MAGMRAAHEVCSREQELYQSGPVVSGVLRTPDGVINLGPKAKLRLRKAAALLK